MDWKVKNKKQKNKEYILVILNQYGREVNDVCLWEKMVGNKEKREDLSHTLKENFE